MQKLLRIFELFFKGLSVFILWFPVVILLVIYINVHFYPEEFFFASSDLDSFVEDTQLVPKIDIHQWQRWASIAIALLGYVMFRPFYHFVAKLMQQIRLNKWNSIETGSFLKNLTVICLLFFIIDLLVPILDPNKLLHKGVFDLLQGFLNYFGKMIFPKFYGLSNLLAAAFFWKAKKEIENHIKLDTEKTKLKSELELVV